MGGTTDLTGTPAFLGSSSISYSAKDVRRFMTAAPIIYTQGGEGIVESGDFAVSQRAAGANMSVDVAAGEAYVKGDTNADEGSYYCRETGTLNATFTASDATNPRIDRVVLEVKNDSEDSSGLNKARIRVIDGTPTVGATLTNLTGAASVPSTCLLLANVLVGAGVTTILTANIQDRRFGVPIAGRRLFGGFSEITSGGSGAGDKTSITVIGDGNTPVDVEWFSGAMATNAAAGNATGVRIRDGAGGTGTIYNLTEAHNAAANYELACYIKARIAAWSGSRTYYANLYTASGTPFVVAAATSPAQLRATWSI